MDGLIVGSAIVRNMEIAESGDRTKSLDTIACQVKELLAAL